MGAVNLDRKERAVFDEGARAHRLSSLQIISTQIQGVDDELEILLSVDRLAVPVLKLQFFLLDLRLSLGLIDKGDYLQMVASRIEKAVEICFNGDEAEAVANLIWRKIRQLSVN